MENQKVACPYCGHKINNSIEKCPNCGEFFVEPAISGFKFVSIPSFLICETILNAFGLFFIYSLFWISSNFKNIRNIAIQRDLNKFNILFISFCIFVFFSIIFKPLFLLVVIIEIMLSYRILRIIEKFTMKEYNSSVTHHEIGMLIFRTLYVVYYLDTYAMRVKDPNLRYCLDIEKWFKYAAIFAVVAMLLYGLSLIVSLPILYNLKGV